MYTFPCLHFLFGRALFISVDDFCFCPFPSCLGFLLLCLHVSVNVWTADRPTKYTNKQTNHTFNVTRVCVCRNCDFYLAALRNIRPFAIFAEANEVAK